MSFVMIFLRLSLLPMLPLVFKPAGFAIGMAYATEVLFMLSASLSALLLWLPLLLLLPDRSTDMGKLRPDVFCVLP